MVVNGSEDSPAKLGAGGEAFPGDIITPAMIAVFALVLFFLAFFTGLGLPMARVLRQPLPETLFAAFFIGWGAALAALQIWHLLLPVNLIVLIGALVTSLAGWSWKGRPVMAWLRARPTSQLAVMGGLALGMLYLLVNQALHSPASYDHGLYHLPMVRWLQAYPIVPGLGNLHHRLAFNNASFLVVAMMDTGPLRGLIYYTATTVLYAALGLRCLLGAYRVAQGAPDARNQLYALLLPVTLWYGTRGEYEYAGYATDSVVFVLQAVLAAELLHAFHMARESAPQPDRKAHTALLLFLSAVGLAVKMSFIVYGIGVILAALWAWWAGARLTRQELRADLGWMASLFALVLLPWLARHALLSGYLLYPSTALSLPVLWKIPPDMAAPVADGIQTWARTAGIFPAGQPFAVWFDWWLGIQSFEFKETWIYSALLLALVLVLRIAARRAVPGERGLWAVLAITIAGLAFWFYAAPASRFAAALPWLLPLIPGLMLIRRACGLGWLRAPHAAVAGGMILILLWLQPGFTNNVARAWLVLPPRESELAAQLAAHDPQRSRATASGLVVYLAADGSEERCFDQPLPCTRASDFDPRLSLIDPARPGSGFWVKPSP